MVSQVTPAQHNPAAVPEAASASGTPDGDRAVRPVAAEDRGSTTIMERAVASIATRVVAECERAGGTATRVLGITLEGAGAHQDADVAVRLHGQRSVSLSVRASVPYPSPVRQAAATLREQLRDKVGALTGMAVQRIDITVTALTTSTRRGLS